MWVSLVAQGVLLNAWPLLVADGVKLSIQPGHEWPVGVVVVD